jgi:hypothetical protein
MNQYEMLELYRGCMKLFSDNVCTSYSIFVPVILFILWLSFSFSIFLCRKLTKRIHGSLV